MDTEITEVQVAVKTLTVNGKKMSWNFFKQIPTKWFEEGTILGYVPIKDPLVWVVFVHNGTLYRYLPRDPSKVLKEDVPQLYIGS